MTFRTSALLLVANVLLLALFVWWRNSTRTIPDPAHPELEVKVVDVAEDAPRFKREYAVVINEHVSMRITMRTIYGRTSSRGELTQGSKWVLFDPESPADKILDRQILPRVIAFCQTIQNMDAQYRRTPPSQFTDKSGHVWARVK